MEEWIRVQDEIVIDRTEKKVAKENDDKLTKEVIVLRNELIEVVSFCSNIDNNSDVVEMLYQQSMEMKEERCLNKYRKSLCCMREYGMR